MSIASKKRKNPSANLPVSPVKIEVKEENIHGNDYMMAKGRLHGVLRQLRKQSASDSDSTDDSGEHRRKRNSSQPTAFHHTYVMKLFDRSVDLARFEEDTPLYPICRAWMANQPRNPQPIIKRRLSSPDPDHSLRTTDVYRLPPPMGTFTSRIPSPTPEQKEQSREININSDENPPVAREVLIRNHIRRWGAIKKKWIDTAKRNEQRYNMSKQILDGIYAKSQDSLGSE